jgi:SAM-dependent methyltransferase
MAACCQEGQLILDAGVGNSPYRDFLPGRIVGIDIRATPFVDVQASLDDLPFPDGLFDGLACYQVLLYRRDPVPWLKEIHRVMKRGAWFALSVSRPKAVHRERTWDAAEKTLCDWPGRRWVREVMLLGLSDDSPLVERVIRRNFGSYFFRLFRNI